jgi:1-deoxy-D-xylulose-5-phosphate synthase
MGGFGSALLEAAADAGLSAAHVRRLGIPDRFVEHGDRNELLADLGLDVEGIALTCRELAAAHASGNGQLAATASPAAHATGNGSHHGENGSRRR